VLQLTIIFALITIIIIIVIIIITVIDVSIWLEINKQQLGKEGEKKGEEGNNRKKIHSQKALSKITRIFVKKNNNKIPKESIFNQSFFQKKNNIYIFSLFLY
jgi:hypothetical protein